MLDILTFSGRLHPVVVHLPIGFLLLAVLLDLVAWNVRFRYLRQAVPFVLFIGFLSAVIACLFGYLLSLSGDYDLALLDRHKLSGIALAVCSGILLGVRTRMRTFSPRIFSGLLVGMLLLLSYSGHQGGNLTHGSDYLSLQTLFEEKREKPVSASAAFLYEDVVQPLLQQKCGQCHGPGKRKGELSLANYAELMDGGKSGPAVVPGKLVESELFRRITLDPAHEEYMPTDGKPPLTEDETGLIAYWITQAGAKTGQSMEVLQANDTLLMQVAEVLGLDNGPSRSAKASSGSDYRHIPETLDMALVEALRNKGLNVRLNLRQPVVLDVTLPDESGLKATDFQQELLAVRNHVVWLNLSDNHFTDEDLAILAELPNLEKLRIENNPVTDGIVPHLQNLQYLTSLNLNATLVTPAAISVLKKNPKLERVFHWQPGEE